MSINLTVNGVSYSYPQTGDSNWGVGATNWAQAVTSGMLQLAGGSFPLTAQVDFGILFGLKALYLLSETVSASATGVLRLANTDGINWRNVGNTADLSLKPDADGFLQYNAIDLVNLSSAQTLTNKTLSGASNTFTGISLTTAITGTLPIANGGTGQITASAAFGALSPITTTGDLIYSSAGTTAARLGIGGTNQVLTVTAGLPSWQNNAAGFANPMTTLGDTIYENATPAAARLAGNITATKNFLIQTGTGTVSAAPTWGTIVVSDVPTLNQSTAGSAASVSGTNVVTNSNLSQMPANTLKGNNTAGVANAADLTAVQARALISSLPNYQQFLTGSGTYTVPANALYLRVRMVGGGGGGAGAGLSPSPGTAGTASTFGTTLLNTGGGSFGVGTGTNGGAGGTASLGTGPVGIALSGAAGTGGTANNASSSMQAMGGGGGSTPFGGAGGGGGFSSTPTAAVANTGSGGGGGGGTNITNEYTGPGGGAGGFIDCLITTLLSTYSYAIGAAGTGGAGGASNGAAGATGFIEVIAYFQ